MAGKRRKPLAVCSRCGEQTGHVRQVGQRCYRVIDDERCKGTLRGVADPDDWQECPACAAAGWIEGVKCDRCAGHGWLRDELG